MKQGQESINMKLTATYTAAPPKRADLDNMNGPVLLEFGSPGCGYCRAAQPLLATAAADTPELPHIKVADGRGLALGRSFHVKLWPTLIFMRDGKEISRLVRPDSASALREALADIIESP